MAGCAGSELPGCRRSVWARGHCDPLRQRPQGMQQHLTEPRRPSRRRPVLRSGRLAFLAGALLACGACATAYADDLPPWQQPLPGPELRPAGAPQALPSRLTPAPAPSAARTPAASSSAAPAARPMRPQPPLVGTPDGTAAAVRTDPDCGYPRTAERAPLAERVQLAERRTAPPRSAGSSTWERPSTSATPRPAATAAPTTPPLATRPSVDAGLPAPQIRPASLESRALDGYRASASASTTAPRARPHPAAASSRSDVASRAPARAPSARPSRRGHSVPALAGSERSPSAGVRRDITLPPQPGCADC